MSYRLLLTFLFLNLLLTTANLTAQVIPPETGESETPDILVGSQYSIVPLVGYSSDMGLYGGGLIQRINYGNNVRPFLSNLAADVTISTKGNIISDLNYERTRTFGTDIRSRIDFIAQKIKEGHYFGIGNQTEFSDERFDENYFFFENREFVFYYQARKNIFSFGEYGNLDFAASADFSYVNGIVREEESKYAEDTPFGFGKSWGNKAGVGFIADSRDNEFSPTQGFRYEVSYEVSTPLLGSDYEFSDVGLDVRHYLQLYRNVVLAQKMHVQSIQGNAPFWDLAIIGGNDGLRGYHLDRFRGESSVMHLLELRTWLFSFLNDGIKVGSQAFWDTGRVFSDDDSGKLFENWKQSYGGGVIFSVFNPDLMLRADVGFSDEAYRIYFGAGYVF